MQYGKAEQARSLGADHVIDYTKEDFTKGEERYDLIYDNVGNHSFSERRRVLKPNGICVLAGIGGAGVHQATWGRIAGNFKAELLSRSAARNSQLSTTTEQKGSKFAARPHAAGKLKPVIEKTYTMSETAEAIRI